MARLARVVAADVPHHVTQRGNARRFLLSCDADRKVYLDLLREDMETCKVSLIGYCLMSNHVHLVVVPARAEGLAKALKRTHGRYASYWNAAHGSSGLRLARPLLFLSVGPDASLGGIALHGVEPRASGLGGRGWIVGVVERGRTLRHEAGG